MNDPIYDDTVVAANVANVANVAKAAGKADSRWRWFWAGALVALAVLAVLALAVAFLAYDRPDLLLDFANLRYCG
ncbi:hypothetical protein OTERR_22390 [Oryzomicrobium terrae]|uniref:Uncharacterized protein n=1 Tax=Oryzomicrobium terrae TaxID=1735038 RepID=A0A5C1EAK5_9RHOO|nr:hypothetical protein [Oryzomicrobium terrae]QEL65715.1 hypothetical protein OTERR_22390 [Oryzomicrobium terrae]